MACSFHLNAIENQGKPQMPQVCFVSLSFVALKRIHDAFFFRKKIHLLTLITILRDAPHRTVFAHVLWCFLSHTINKKIRKQNKNKFTHFFSTMVSGSLLARLFLLANKLSHDCKCTIKFPLKLNAFLM